MLAASLATWSVSDPSFNHATGGQVRNALGTPGAVLADILMQTIGLATAVFLIPLVLWGWRLLTGHALGIGLLLVRLRLCRTIRPLEAEVEHCIR